MDENKDLNQSNNNEMSADQMFNSWTQTLMGDQGNNEQQSVDSAKEEVNGFSFQSTEEKSEESEISMQPQNDEPKVEINNEMGALNYSPDDNEVKISKPVVDEVIELSSEFNQEPKEDFSQKEEKLEIPNPVYNGNDGRPEFSAPVSDTFSFDEEKSTGGSMWPSVVMIVIIIGILVGGFIMFRPSNEDNLNSVNTTGEQQANEKDNVPDPDSEPEPDTVVDTGDDPGEENKPSKPKHDEELKKLCTLLDKDGNYYADMDPNSYVTLDALLEKAHYCSTSICFFTEDDYVYSRDCKTGLARKNSVSDMKILVTLQMTCSLVDKNGYYYDATSGIKCSNNNCSVLLNGRNYNAVCK